MCNFVQTLKGVLMENSIAAQTPTDVELLKQHQELYISYCAMGGVITSDDGKVTTMPASKFAERIGVHRNTLNNWKSSIPNFADRVRARRGELFSLSRETAIFNRLYIIGMTGTDGPAVKALEVLAGHFSKLEKPVQRQDLKVSGSLAEVLSNAQKIIEGEVADGTRPADAL